MRKFLAAVVLLLGGCALPPKPPPPALVAPPAAPAGPFLAYEIVASRLEVRVYRDGPMAQLGHNHVITSEALRGNVQLREPREDTRFLLELPLESLLVDDETARAAAGADFTKPVPEADREATRRNLLGPALLDLARQPVIRLSAQGLEGGPTDYQAIIGVSLRGEERSITVPLSFELEGEELHVQAHFSLRHADLGLLPYSVALGALRVRDEFEIDCRLTARPVPPA